MKLHVFEIERFAINDGPGIRTTVFLQGCPLHCPWCANPESQRIEKHLMYQSNQCIRCGRCAVVCPRNAIEMVKDVPVFHRDLCNTCGLCAQACMNGAISFSGKLMDAQEILDIVLRDESYYRHANGGITISGGEPLAQHEGLKELLTLCKNHELHTAVETTGNVRREIFNSVSPLVDLFLFDYKHPSARTLRDVTGGNLAMIVENLRSVSPDKVTLRIPVIPTFNADEETLTQIFRDAISMGIQRVDLLPYHTMGVDKYKQMGSAYPFAVDKALRKYELEPFKIIGRKMGLQIS